VSKLKYDELLSNFGCKFNLRRYAAVLQDKFTPEQMKAQMEAGAYTRSHFRST
jgi:hypothetical protein